jgi:type IV secretory pathway VirB10-like protein
MKPKILYITLATLAILIIVILISILITRERAKIQPVSEEVKPEQTATQQPRVPLDYSQQPPLRSAITVVKPRAKEKPTLTLEETEEQIKKSQQQETLSASTPSSRQGQTVSGKETNEPPSAITEVSKYPTEKEKQEMDERGIIMY